MLDRERLLTHIRCSAFWASVFELKSSREFSVKVDDVEEDKQVAKLKRSWGGVSDPSESKTAVEESWVSLYTDISVSTIARSLQKIYTNALAVQSQRHSQYWSNSKLYGDRSLIAVTERSILKSPFSGKFDYVTSHGKFGARREDAARFLI